MVGPTSKVTIVVIKEIGKRLTTLAAKKAGSRYVGHMARNSRAWRKAFRHIDEHFRAAGGKASHAIFSKKYRNEGAIKQLIHQVASSPSRAPVKCKLTIGGANLGRPAVILEHRFSQSIGKIGDEACHILRVVIDYTGRPITAYPEKDFIGSAGRKAAGKAITATGGVLVATSAKTAGAQSPVDVYFEFIAAERAEQQERSDGYCKPHGVAEWVIDFLVSPSCSAPDAHQLISVQEVNKRVSAVTAALAAKVGTSLDPQTKANIRADVIAVWGMGYRME